MKVLAKRLVKGKDLKDEIELIVKENKIKAGVVLSAVGCVSTGRFRVADGESIRVLEEPLEIVSLQGTVGSGGVHLHISLGDSKGNCFGGHLTSGNIINTTCELVIGVLSGLIFERELDITTGYKEMNIK